MNSEYSWKQIREIIVSGIRGFKRKENLKKINNEPKYRSGSQSLESRVQKKLCEKYNWFKKRKMKGNEEDTENENSSKNKWNHYKKKKK